MSPNPTSIKVNDHEGNAVETTIVRDHPVLTSGIKAIWHHTSSIPDVFDQLLTNSGKGLTTQEAAYRIEKSGPNVLTPPRPKPMWQKIAAHFTDFFSLLLQFAAILCFLAFVSEPTEKMHLYLGLFLYAVVIITSLFSFLQQYKSDQTLKEFRNFLPPKATVVRDYGDVTVINACRLVAGDIIQMKLGDKVPADVRIIESSRFTVDKSSLTGESDPVELDARVSSKEAIEATNLAFFGSTAVDGSAKAVVIATGDRTVFGEIARLTSKSEEEEEETTLQKEIHHFVINISLFAVAIGMLFFVAGLIRGSKFIHNVVYSIGIIVSNIPEGLLATVTVSLTASARRMAQRNILVKKLDAVESLGSTTTICSDKTGTLTQNRMKVSHLVYVNEIESLNENWELDFKHRCLRDNVSERNLCQRSLFFAASLCSTAVFDGSFLRRHPSKSVDDLLVTGDASEAGILRFTHRIHDTFAFRKRHKVVAMLPFNSRNKYMATVHAFPNNTLRTVLKGAPEVVLSLCTTMLSPQGVQPLTCQDRARIEERMSYLASQGERILGYAELTLSDEQTRRLYDRDGFSINVYDIPTTELCFLGLISLIDPPRDGVSEAVSTCRTAGIKAIMVTGDHPDTARAIARKVGILSKPAVTEDEEIGPVDFERSQVVVKGNELHDMTDEHWDKILRNDEIVFARTSPHQKLDIVQQLQRRGEVVTVTGDGCNDAPALKQANTGIAMGISGSEVSREAADIVILDDHFASIVNGVEEGRLIFDNLKKSIAYTLTSNVPQLIPFIVFLLLQIPLPLTTVLILSIDLGTDIFPAIALAYEEPENDIMKRPPRKANRDHLMNSRLVSYSTFQLGIVQTFAGFFAYLVVFSDYGLRPRTLINLSAGSFFGSARLKSQRWLISTQDAPQKSGYEANWFTREHEMFKKYFDTAHPGFLKQTADQYSFLSSDPASSTPAQFSNMLKIVGFKMKRPSCAAYECSLDVAPSVTVRNDIRCFDPTKNAGAVKLQRNATVGSNAKTIPGREDWHGCFSLWTPDRQREVLRRAQTSFFAAIVIAQAFTLFACKTRVRSLFVAGVRNVALEVSLVLELMVSIIIVYAPIVRTAFGARPLRWVYWFPGVPFGLFIIAYDELRKLLIRRHIRNGGETTQTRRGCLGKIAKWVHDFTLW